MFDILFGWRKASKCKKLIEMLRCRLKVVKSKTCCIAKHSRDDVSQLLKHGHRRIAFQRVEQIIVDESTIQSYDLLDQYSQVIMFHLRYIRRQRDCPDDINEAASTLIFSSQRFGELSELIPIRKLFGERYGHRFVINALELRPGNLVNPQIIDHFYIKNVSEDLKYGLLAEITTSSIKQAQLFLEYKPGAQQDQAMENINRLSCGEVQVHDNYGTPEEHDTQGRFMYVDSSSSHECLLGLRKERSLGDAGRHLSLHEKESCSDIIYYDHIEEFVSPLSKDGGLQDLRLFVFKSFGMIPLNNEAYYETEIGLEDQQAAADDKLLLSRSSSEMVPYEEPHSEYSSCRHIHPKLPDYDELAAKFKALKRENLEI